MQMKRASRAYTRYELRTAAAFAVSYLALFLVSRHFLPSDSYLYPSTSIAIAAVYFGGGRLTPVVFFIALIAALFGHLSIALSLAISIAVALQAYAGAFALRWFGIDPLFRKSRDIFILLGSCALVALIGPSIVGITLVVQGTPFILSGVGVRLCRQCVLFFPDASVPHAVAHEAALQTHMAGDRRDARSIRAHRRHMCAFRIRR